MVKFSGIAVPVSDRAPHPEPEQPYDSADPEQVERRQIAAARREKAKLDVVAALMASPDGRAWVWSELVAASIFTTTFVPGDPMASAFSEGGRNAGLRLLAQVMRAAPDAYVLMQREAGNE